MKNEKTNKKGARTSAHIQCKILQIHTTYVHKFFKKKKN